MNAFDLKKIESLATPGPWEGCFEEDPYFGEETVIRQVGVQDSQVVGTGYYDGLHAVLTEADSKLVVSIRNLAPELIGLWLAVDRADHYLGNGIREAMAALEVKASLINPPAPNA